MDIVAMVVLEGLDLEADFQELEVHRLAVLLEESLGELLEELLIPFTWEVLGGMTFAVVFPSPARSGAWMLVDETSDRDRMY